ncbi:hypothetical protein GCM10023184_47150 [Flaviaesturariibacter amylovorans]|uniref:DUF1877 family protein n=2 Tax=Flaviaesturariibacter amylovorans TaxID=1084520 RepID=A0ABP8HVK5_9BACT
MPVADNVLQRVLEGKETIDATIDRIHEVDWNRAFYIANGTIEDCYKEAGPIYSIDKAWAILQYALYPEHDSNPGHPLSKAIAIQSSLLESDREAGYLWSSEVKEVWEALKKVSANTLIENLNVPTESYFYGKYKSEEEKVDNISYALMKFSNLLLPYYFAQLENKGLIIYMA